MASRLDGPGLGPGPGCEIVVLGAHGGAGTTTLAILLRPAWDLGVVRRPARGRAPLRTRGRPVALVTRNTVAAAGRATAALNAITSDGVRVAVLAVVSDGLPEPAAASYRFGVLEPRVGAIVRVPFVPVLRAVDNPAQVDLPRRARWVLADIRAQAMARAAGPASTRTPAAGPASTRTP